MRTPGHVVRLVIAFGSCTLLGGCVLSTLLTRIEAGDMGGLSTTVAELYATGGTGAACLGGLVGRLAAPELTTAVKCLYIIDGEIVTSTSSLELEFGLFGLLFDPVILQVPAAATAFSGTFTGPGGTQALQITEVVGTLRADVSTNIAAQPGTKLVIVDFSAAPSTNTSYDFALQFRLPGNVPTVPVKALFAAKVTVAGQTYYPPLLPCETNFANVPGVDLTQSTAFQPVTLPSATGRGCAGRVYQFVPGSTTPDLNQHGLTGSWYEPATDGQGFEVEVFPDLVAPGTGSVQLSWFTFDTVAGGANRQRWYTLSGNMVSGQPNASLKIYQNTGGNFNALPITNGVPVGTATLSFSTCTSGQLSYTFTDGSGRTGSIPLTRITQNVTCSTTSTRPTNADFAFSGNWYDSATSGQGFVVEVNPNNGSVFVPWYTYAPAGASAGPAGQRWYTASGSFAPGARSIVLKIFETTGRVFDAPTSNPPPSVEVGTATLTFQSCSNGTFSFNFTAGSSSGMSGTIALIRIGPIPAGCVL